MREQILKLSLVTLGVVALSTEALSLARSVSFVPVLLVWMAVLAGWIRGLKQARISWRWDWLCGPLVGCAIAIWALEGVTALVSPPNSSDAMAYHLPRVVYWVQQRSVAFFATPYLNQIMLQPLQEYVTLHWYLLAGGDRLANAAAWLATGGYVLGATLVARALGAERRGQALAALFAATLPNGILQASGAKNEALLSCLLVALVHFALSGQRWWVGLAFGLACFTKGTAFLFCSPLLVLLAPRAIPHALLGLALINGTLFVRNVDLSGSPLGFDSAQGDGRFRWRNEPPGPAALVSNLLRHSTEQLGSRDDRSNRMVYNWSIALHGVIGVNPNDPATTWPGEAYRPPRSANHETDANNRWHLLLILLATPYLRGRRQWLIVLGLSLGVVLFCGYLKWQPFMSRMWLPLFAAGTAMAAAVWARAHVCLQIAVCIFLITGSRLPLLKSWIRPLTGSHSVLSEPREEMYFADMKTWEVRNPYFAAAAEIERSGCRRLGVDINRFQLEYPLQALLLRRMPDMKFVHVNTVNASRKYEPSEPRPCAVVCLACERWVTIDERK